MAKPSNWKKIERELENLCLRDQEKLAARLAQRLRQGRPEKKSCNWKKLYGLGKGLWRGEDAQDYVNRLREDRV
jgi:hypothetical protein